jgi:hypothetical protein
MAVENLPTHFGKCSFAYQPDGKRATLTLSGEAAPPGGFPLALPRSLVAKVTIDGRPVSVSGNGDRLLPPKAKRVQIELAAQRAR